MVKLKILFLISLVFLSCIKSNDKGNASEKPKSEGEKIDSIRKELGITWEKKFLAEMNLSDLTVGVDSFEMRFNVSGIIKFTPDLFYILKYANDEWRCFEYSYSNKNLYDDNSIAKNFWEVIRGGIDKMTIDSFSCKRIFPQSSWKNLIDSLRYYDITNLPDQKEIKGFVYKIEDGMWYHLEIATPSKHSDIIYNEPQFYNDEYNKRMTKILLLLERELKFPVSLDTNLPSPSRS